MFKKSLVLKISMIIFVTSLFVALTISVVSLISSRQIMTEEAEKLLDNIAGVEGKKIELVFEKVNYYLNASAEVLENTFEPDLIKDGERTYLEKREKDIIGIMEGLANAIPEQMGLYFNLNPYYFDFTYTLTLKQESNGTISRDPYLDMDYYQQTGSSLDWMRKPIETRGNFITEPYYYEGYGNIVSFTKPVIVDNIVIGVIGLDMQFESVKDIVMNARVYETGYGFLTDSEGQVIVHPALEAGVVDDIISPLIENAARNGKTYFEYDYNGSKKVAALRTFPNGWVFLITVPESEIHASLNTLQFYILLIITVTLAIVVFLSYLLGKSIAKPIKNMSKTIIEFGKGDFTQSFDVKSEDEIGQMADSLNIMSSELRKSFGSIRAAVDSVKSSSENLSSISEESSAISEELSSQSESVVHNAQDTSASIEEVNAGIEEISSSAQNVSNTAQELADEVLTTKQASDEGKTEMDEQGVMMNKVDEQNKAAMTLVREVAEKSSNVQEIVNTIASISEQTNLLALNAAIEAARAGEAGKGFAVVADEIRKLAEESKTATQNIASILNEIDDGATKANTAVDKTVQFYENLLEGTKKVEREFNKISTSIDSISVKVEALSASAQEQGAATEEMASGMETSSKSMEEITEQMQDMNRAVGEQSTSALHVNSAAEELSSLAEKLFEEVKKFKIDTDEEEKVLNIITGKKN